MTENRFVDAIVRQFNVFEYIEPEHALIFVLLVEQVFEKYLLGKPLGKRNEFLNIMLVM